jgi:hypothetical protein
VIPCDVLKSPARATIACMKSHAPSQWRGGVLGFRVVRTFHAIPARYPDVMARSLSVATFPAQISVLLLSRQLLSTYVF